MTGSLEEYVSRSLSGENPAPPQPQMANQTPDYQSQLGAKLDALNKIAGTSGKWSLNENGLDFTPEPFSFAQPKQIGYRNADGSQNITGGTTYSPESGEEDWSKSGIPENIPQIVEDPVNGPRYNENEIGTVLGFDENGKLMTTKTRPDLAWLAEARKKGKGGLQDLGSQRDGTDIGVSHNTTYDKANAVFDGYMSTDPVNDIDGVDVDSTSVSDAMGASAASAAADAANAGTEAGGDEGDGGKGDGGNAEGGGGDE